MATPLTPGLSDSYRDSNESTIHLLTCKFRLKHTEVFDTKSERQCDGHPPFPSLPCVSSHGIAPELSLPLTVPYEETLLLNDH